MLNVNVVALKRMEKVYNPKGIGLNQKNYY